MRLIVVVVLLVMVVAVGGVLVLGAFPPSPRTEQIQRVLPNDRFQTR